MANPPNNPPENPEQSARVKQMVTLEATAFSGTLPPPNLLLAYEEISPVFADRIVSMAEQEGVHRRKTEDKMSDANVEAMRLQFSESRWGQVLAFFISMAFLFTGAYTAIHGQPWVGGVLGSMGLSGIVASFIAGRQKQIADPEPPPQQNTKGLQKKSKRQQRTFKTVPDIGS